MITISLCMIVRDEAETLAKTLRSVANFMDEIIIVDTGSKDDTKKIASEFTSKIYDFAWINDFSAARNFAFSKAKCDFCMWLDADDVLLDAEQAKFKDLKATLTLETDVVIMKYDVATQCCFSRERLVKRTRGFLWHEPVHEYLLFEGNCLNSDIHITHQKVKPVTHRNLDIYEQYLSDGKLLSERGCYYYAKELVQVGKLKQAIPYFEAYLLTVHGLCCTYMDSCIELANIYHHLNDSNNEIKALLRFFENHAPRPEIFCRIGAYFKEKNEMSIAKLYFELALHIPKPSSNWGYLDEAAWTYVPYMELVACCYYEGDIEGALTYNSLVADLYPNDSKVLHNQELLEEVKNQLVELAK